MNFVLLKSRMNDSLHRLKRQIGKWLSEKLSQIDENWRKTLVDDS